MTGEYPNIIQDLWSYARPIDEFNIDPANAMRHRDEDLNETASSLHEFKQRTPIVVNTSGGKNIIEKGNGTWLAAKRLGWTHIAAVGQDDDPVTHVRYGIADNATGRIAKWDVQMLDALLQQQNDPTSVPGVTAEMAEQVAADLKALVNGADGEDTEPQVDQAEELAKEWGTGVGQLWQLGEHHRLICGDCTDAAVVAKVMGGEVAALVSDPPYGISIDTSWLSALHIQRGKPANMSDNKLANDDGSLDLSFAFKYQEWIMFGFPHIARNESYTGLLVWDKRGDGGEKGLGNPIEIAASNSFNGYKLRRHVWAGYVREAGERRQPHPTQKPVGIMQDAIELVKNRNIFDPFLGSGTTMIACENLNRKCIGIELDPGYVAVTLQRYLDHTGVKPELID